MTSPDYDWEADIMGFYGDKLNHPNEKRVKFAELVSKIDGSDARIISTVNADSGMQDHPELIIPLKDFCSHVVKFKYNVNVSGYRLSVPNRFIESFMVGTGILTDKLHCKWHLPFEDEVVETVDMGYLPNEEVDWEKAKDDLQNVEPQKIIDSYENKWNPEVVARYIMDTVNKAWFIILILMLNMDR